MRKNSAYDFEKLFVSHNLKKTTVRDLREQPSREGSTHKVSHLAQTKQLSIKTNNFKSSQMDTKNQSANISSRGNSNEKSSRKPSQANINLMSVGPSQDLNQVDIFFNSLGKTIVKKYVPIAMHHVKDPVKRNLIPQILKLKYQQNYSQQTTILAKTPITAFPQPASIQLSVKPPSSLTRQHKFINKQAYQSTSSLNSQSSRNSSQSKNYMVGNQSQISAHLKAIQERYRQSQQKLKGIKTRLSRLHSLKSESSQKSLQSSGISLIKPKVTKMTRYNSILLR